MMTNHFAIVILIPATPLAPTTAATNSLFDVVGMEPLALFAQLSVEFLEEFDVFAPARAGRTRDHELPQVFYEDG